MSFITILSFCLTDSIADTRDLLELSLEELCNIQVVTASKHFEKASKAPATIYVVTEKDIVENGYFTLMDILENIPGIFPIHLDYFTFGGHRGMLNNFSQTLLMIDGREVQNLIAAETFIGQQFATDNVKQVEFIQGPGSALYGANALAGVINIITKTGCPLKNETRVVLEAGHQGTRGMSVNYGKIIGDLKISGSVRYFYSDMWDFSEEVVDTNNFRSGYPSAVNYEKMDYSNSTRAVPLQFNLYYGDFYGGYQSYFLKSRGGIENISLDYASQYDERQLELVFMGYEHDFNKRLKIKTEFQYYKEKINVVNFIFYQDIFDRLIELGRDEFEKISEEEIHSHFMESTSQELGNGSDKKSICLQAFYHPSEALSIVGGYCFYQNDLRGMSISAKRLVNSFNDSPDEDNPSRLPYFKRDKHALFFQYQRKVFNDKFRLTLGGRYVHHETFKGFFVFRGGLVFSPDQTTHLKLLYGEGFREPNIFEQGAFIPTFNDELDPAKIKSYELSLTKRLFSFLNFNSVIYYNLLRDNIISSDTYRFYNDESEDEIWGVENSGTFMLDKFSFKMGYSYVDPENKKLNGKEYKALGVYSHSLFANVQYRLTSCFSLGLKSIYWGKAKALHGNPNVDEVISLKELIRVDCNFSLNRWKYKEMNFILMGSIKNIFNRDNYLMNPRRGGPKSFPQPGRVFTLRLCFDY